MVEDNERAFFSDPNAVLDLLSVVVVVDDEVVEAALLSVGEDVSLLSAAAMAEPRFGPVSILPARADTREIFFSVLVLLLVDVELVEELLPDLLTADVLDALSSKNLLATSLALDDTRNDLPLDVVVVVVLVEDEDDDKEDLE